MQFISCTHKQAYQRLNGDAYPKHIKEALYVIAYLPERIQKSISWDLQDPQNAWMDFSYFSIRVSKGEQILLQLANDLYNGTGNFDIAFADMYCDTACKQLIANALFMHFDQSNAIYTSI